VLFMKFLSAFKCRLNLLLAVCLGPGFHPRGVSRRVTQHYASLAIVGDSGWVCVRARTPDTARKALALRRFLRAGDTTLSDAARRTGSCYSHVTSGPVLGGGGSPVPQPPP